MAAYLLAWNPKRWDWPELPDVVAAFKRGETIPGQWSCGRNKKPRVGDTVFLIRLGKEPKGIFAHGTVTSPSFEDTHWEDSKKTSRYVMYHTNAIVNPETDSMISRDRLNAPPYSRMHWDIQGSGIHIPDDIAATLLAEWSQLVSASFYIYPDDIDTTKTYREGAQRIVVVNTYERNAFARAACVDHYGPQCVVCGFDFGCVYGDVGRGLIHVHHLIPLAEIGDEYEIHPIADLRPVCPNCHAIIHRRPSPSPPFTIDEVTTMLRAARQSV